MKFGKNLKRFGGEPIYNEKYLKAKIKSYHGKIKNQISTIIKYQKKVLDLFVSNFDRFFF